MKFLRFFLLLLPVLLAAENIAIGTRPMNEEAKAQMEAERGGEDPPLISGFLFDRSAPVYFSQSYHWLIAVTLLDHNEYAIRLEDDSAWKINRYDAGKALGWLANDPLIITQNNQWFSQHAYRIVNKSNGSSVEADLFTGPLEYGPYTRYITGLDYNSKTLTLSDNTHWEISWLDSSTFRDWALSDALIIGTNSGWDASCGALLINVNMNNAARAKQF